jgi:uncharacterized protein DUF4325
MVIRILDFVQGADTSEQGALVLARLQAALTGGTEVTISFDGINTATSSFVNAGILPLLQQFPLNELKTRLRIVESTRQINDMIKMRMEREASAVTA